MAGGERSSAGGDVDPGREAALERGWREVSVVDAAYARGELDEQGWHRAMQALTEPSYLADPDGYAGSGYSGTASGWRETRSLVMAAVDRDVDLLDVGCANGLLMGSVHAWGRERGLSVEPYGVDVSAALAEVARRRLPRWAERIWTANAATWRPPRRFDVVRTGLEYVPADRQRAFVRHLVEHVVAPGGRLVVGKSNEVVGRESIAERLEGWGHRIAGSASRPHARPDVVYTAYWIDPE